MSDDEKAGIPPDSVDSQIIDVDELMRNYEVESRTRVLKGVVKKVVTIIAVIMSLFHLYMAGLGTLPTCKQRMIHLGLALLLIFLLYPFAKKNSSKKHSILDYILGVMGLGVNLYLLLNIDAISMRAGLTTNIDLIVGGIAILLVLEAARRCVGVELPALAVLFLMYTYLGPYLPRAIAHRGYSIQRIIEHMFISAEGIYGVALGVSSTYIFLFILFGAFLGETGLSKLFTNISMALAGHKPGGPAKVSIIASGFLGMINGSAAANVVTTGAFTIPLMKKIGYKSYFAGAVEAVASTGGQIMPPVMGAAAFIMAEFLGVSYKTIMLSALIPAILYYVALWANVHLEALKLGLSGLAKENLPKAGKELKENGHLLLPIVLLVYLICTDYTPAFAAFYSILSLIVLSSLRKHTRMNLLSLFNSLEMGAKGALGVAIACAVVGIIVGVITITGLGLQLANMILTISGGLLVPTLFLTMVACVILGMGLPTSAAYIVAGTVAAPAMIKLGVLPITAHLFVLYFAVLSAITPPVALAAYAGAGISGAEPTKVGWTAARLGLAGFIVPFMFVFSPGLIFQASSFWVIIFNFATATIGVICLSGAIQGFMVRRANIAFRVVLFISAILLIHGSILTDGIGIILLVLILAVQKAKKRQESENLAGV